MAIEDLDGAIATAEAELADLVQPGRTQPSSEPDTAPRCANEWQRGVCEKPRVRCGACPNQAFLPAGEQAVLSHLQGRQVMGIYPLLADETCWLLAIDLDGDSWPRDVRALQASEELGLAPAVERSRSGAGAHAWFFASPVPAAVARALGELLLTRAVARCSSLEHRLL